MFAFGYFIPVSTYILANCGLEKSGIRLDDARIEQDSGLFPCV